MDEEIEAPLDDLEAMTTDEDDGVGDGKITGPGSGGNSAGTALSSAAR